MSDHKQTPIVVIILQNNPRPQRIFQSLLTGTPIPIKRRVGAHFISEEMEKIEQWAKENNIEISWNYFRDKNVPFLEENMLGVRGLTEEALKNFPLPYIKTEEFHD